MSPTTRDTSTDLFARLAIRMRARLSTGKWIMKTCVGVAAVVAAGILTGCAGAGYDPSHSWDEGWRKGTIVEVGEGVALAEKVAAKCKQPSSPTTSKARYATIKYRRDRRKVSRTMPVPEDFAPKVGDTVFINTRDCAVPVDHRHRDG